MLAKCSEIPPWSVSSIPLPPSRKLEGCWLGVVRGDFLTEKKEFSWCQRRRQWPWSGSGGCQEHKKGRESWQHGKSRVSVMMTSWNGNIFCVTGHLCGECTGHQWIPCTKVSDGELWCFLWSAPVMKSGHADGRTDRRSWSRQYLSIKCKDSKYCHKYKHIIPDLLQLCFNKYAFLLKLTEHISPSVPHYLMKIYPLLYSWEMKIWTIHVSRDAQASCQLVPPFISHEEIEQILFLLPSFAC